MRLAANCTQLAKAVDGKHPISLLAVSGEVLDHWWFGPLLLDANGAVPRQDSVPIDWQHDYEDSIGYLDAFQPDGVKLNVSGYLVPYPEDPKDPATKVIAKAAAGVPYQASVDFSPMLVGDLELEYISKGLTTLVGGKEYSGPLTVLRKWPLNAVALCTHGHDAQTVAQMSAGDTEKTCTLSLPEGFPMTKLQVAGDAEKEKLKAGGEPAKQVESQPKAEPVAEGKLSIDAGQLAVWQQEFGDSLALQLAAGKLTEDGARQEQLKAVKAENANLQAKVNELQKRIDQAQLGFSGKLSPGVAAVDEESPKEGIDCIDKLSAQIEAKFNGKPE